MHIINDQIFLAAQPTVMKATKINFLNRLVHAKVAVENVEYPIKNGRPKALINLMIATQRLFERSGVKNGLVKFSSDEVTLYDNNQKVIAEYQYDVIEWIQIGVVRSTELSQYPTGYPWLVFTIKTLNEEVHFINSDFRIIDTLVPLLQKKINFA